MVVATAALLLANAVIELERQLFDLNVHNEGGGGGGGYGYASATAQNARSAFVGPPAGSFSGGNNLYSINKYKYINK